MADGNPLVLGGANYSNATTLVGRSGSGSDTAFVVGNNNGSAVEAQAGLAGVGVIGIADAGAGVVGRSDSHTGVVGETRGPMSAGVAGRSNTGWGVLGGITDGSATNGAGVAGYAWHGTAVSGISLDGRAIDGKAWAGDAVYGHASGGVGVHGYSEDAEGVRGISPLAGVDATGLGSGVGIRTRASAGSGLVASSTTGHAADFFGTVVVIGGFVAAGPFKAAAVPHPDGTHRLTYCMESPESWFEDFGRARLSGGHAEMRLDPDFAALVRTDDYHVFLTAEGDTAGLYVADRNESGFEVREQRGGDGEVPFSYRVVARRRDVDAGRLAAFELPEIPAEPEAIAPPELPEPPELPDLPPEWPPPPWQQSES